MVLGCISTVRFLIAYEVDAQVAELVDALASGASGRKVVEVRVFSWAPSYLVVYLFVSSHLTALKYGRKKGKKSEGRSPQK